MRVKQWVLLAGLMLSGLPVVAEAASSDLRPKARPSSLSAPATLATIAVPPEVAAPLQAAAEAVPVRTVSALRPVARPASLTRRLARAAAAPQAAVGSATAIAPRLEVASVSTMSVTPRHGTIVESRRAMAVQQAKARGAKGQRIWCVPFARDLSGVALQGNAHTWWKKAAGVYDRGHNPVVGSVMNFKSTRGMPLGHVAVVSKVESPRRILIDHANWTRNKISIGMVVVDVSKNNDWSRVRLESGPGGLGSVYPVAGFIHPART